MEAETRMGWVDLKIEYGCLHSLLFLGCEFGQAAGKSVGDAEVHRIG